MRVVELWLFPVKSMQGQRIDAADIGPHGLAGDRQWAIRDLETGYTLTARREPALLMATPRVTTGQPEVMLPTGDVARSDDDLSAWLGHPVAMVEADRATGARHENPTDAEDEAGAWVTWEGPPGSFHDSTRATLTLVSTATLAGREPRRFRMNVIVSGEGEDDLVGRRIRIGTAELDVQKRIDRCVMVTRPQPGLERDVEVLRRVHRERDGALGVGGLVITAGRVRLGDNVHVLGA